MEQTAGVKQAATVVVMRRDRVGWICWDWVVCGGLGAH